MNNICDGCNYSEDNGSSKTLSTVSGCDIISLNPKGRGNDGCVSDSGEKLFDNADDKASSSKMPQPGGSYDHRHPPPWSLSQCKEISCCVA